MSAELLALSGFTAGLLISILTTPVGVSGAVFLLPVQLDLLNVPNPAVTPTNLLFNVVAGPGALLRYRRQGQLAGPLARQLVAGTLPGVVLGAVIRVYLLPGPDVFRLCAAAVLLPLGVWLCLRARASSRPHASRPLSRPAITALAVAVGVAGGIYGIGGGSLLGPILVSSGLAVATVAPAALTATFLTSIAGALTYTALAAVSAGAVAPDWTPGVACGLGGLLGGYLGARLQPHVPDQTLRLLLGTLAIAVALSYIAQALG